MHNILLILVPILFFIKICLVTGRMECQIKRAFVGLCVRSLRTNKNRWRTSLWDTHRWVWWVGVVLCVNTLSLILWPVSPHLHVAPHFIHHSSHFSHLTPPISHTSLIPFLPSHLLYNPTPQFITHNMHLSFIILNWQVVGLIMNIINFVVIVVCLCLYHVYA